MSSSMTAKEITIERFHPYKTPSFYEESFLVPLYSEHATILEALIYIYENLDPSLAFRYSCRFEKCGLCAVQVDGRPALACVTNLRDGQRIAPLQGLPVIRDLVVDRAPLEKLLQHERAFLVTERPEKLKTVNDINLPPAATSPELVSLLRCVECLCCQAGCSETTRFSLEEFAGPFVFVKLGQLYLDRRDKLDRRAQARKLGIEKCGDCSTHCVCPQGINIQKHVILPLLEGKER